MVGITQNRSVQDEKLIEAIFQSHWSPESRTSSSPVYGATCTNLIIDARPTVNAMANTAKGAGSENMDHYKDGKKAYLGIDHIHAMRDSLAKVVEALQEADNLLASINSDLSDQVGNLAVLDRGALRRSGWLRHISAILEGTLLIARNVHVNSSHVLIHCSDGWDRTSQLSSLSQLCLDPYFRTIRGFEILIEKDWLSFGHKFLDRCGHLSSEKFFLSPTENINSGSGTEAAQAFLASVQNRFASQNHIKETSPVFHQFLESVRQIQRQFPERFEFNEQFLRKIYHHLYSCQFGTFLYNCERERRIGNGGPPPCERTYSVWDFFNAPSELEQIRNLTYDPSLDDPTSRASRADMGVLFPNPKNVRFWNELYGRSDDEMNGRILISQAQEVEITGPIEGSDDDPALQTLALQPSSPSPAPRSLTPSQSGHTPQRSSSPGIRNSLRDLSLSSPEISSRPAAVRVDSFATSSISRPPNSSSVLSSPQSSPLWARTKPPDLSSVKSVWGKLSLNASAAFSVVQDAYAGVAKDLRNNDDSATDTNAELRGRDTLTTWGESSVPVTAPLSAMTSNNPWSTSKVQPLSTYLDESPWGTTDSSMQDSRRGSSIYDQPPSPLPLDPNVATPTPRAFNGTRMHDTRSTTPSPVPPAPPTKASNTTSEGDPLGVGLL